jgi:hypothetical protein
VWFGSDEREEGPAMLQRSNKTKNVDPGFPPQVRGYEEVLGFTMA